MNNKGFAIIGILYTILILFLMIMLSVLAGLNTRKNFMEKSISSFQDDYLGSDVIGNYSAPLISAPLISAPVTGKYVFQPVDSEISCYAYLKVGTVFSNVNLKCSDDSDIIWHNDMGLLSIYEFKG